MAAKPNMFGDVRGENDHKALDESFYEWQDYRTLFESVDRFIVVDVAEQEKAQLPIV